MTKSRIFYVANMSFYAIRENKIIAKISELTVSYLSFSAFEGTLKSSLLGILTARGAAIKSSNSEGT